MRKPGEHFPSRCEESVLHLRRSISVSINESLRPKSAFLSRVGTHVLRAQSVLNKKSDEIKVDRALIAAAGSSTSLLRLTRHAFSGLDIGAQPQLNGQARKFRDDM